MSTAGYHVGHRTQGSVVMYLNSGDAHNQHEGTTSHFSFTFKDAIHTRAGEGVLVSLHSASIPYSFTMKQGKSKQRLQDVMLVGKVCQELE